MEVILLERVAKLGQMGEVVRVKNGFARNYLLPNGKALRATKENRDRFEGMKAELEARNTELRGEAEKASKKGRRQERCRAAPGGRSRPALRLGFRPATSPTLLSDDGYHRQPLADCAECADQGASACTRSRSRCIRKSR